MSFGFSVEPHKDYSLPPLWQAVEGYLSIGGNVREIKEIKEKEICYINTKTQTSAVLTALKVATFIVFALPAFLIRGYYRREYTFKWQSWKQLQYDTKIFFETKTTEIAKVSNKTVDEPCPLKTQVKQELHANYIGEGLTKKHLIAAQAPASNATHALYWTTIWEYNANILNLTSISEQTELGGAYPTKLGETKKFGPISVTVTEKEVTDESVSYTYVTEKEVTDKSFWYTYTLKHSEFDGKEKIIQHFNYQQWLDSKAPSLLTLDFLVNRANVLLENKDTYLLTHCKAGLGRTGLVDSAVILKEHLEEGHKYKGTSEEQAFQIVKTLREQRGPKFVQTEPQYECLLQYAIFLLEKANVENINAKLDKGEFHHYSDDISKEDKEQKRTPFTVNLEKVIGELDVSSAGTKKEKVKNNPQVFKVLCDYTIARIKAQEKNCQDQINEMIDEGQLFLNNLDQSIESLLRELRNTDKVQKTDKLFLTLQDYALLALEKDQLKKSFEGGTLSKENLETSIAGLITIYQPDLDKKAKEALSKTLESYVSSLLEPIQKEIQEMIESLEEDLEPSALKSKIQTILNKKPYGSKITEESPLFSSLLKCANSLIEKKKEEGEEKRAKLLEKIINSQRAVFKNPSSVKAVTEEILTVILKKQMESLADDFELSPAKEVEEKEETQLRNEFKEFSDKYFEEVKLDEEKQNEIFEEIMTQGLERIAERKENII